MDSYFDRLGNLIRDRLNSDEDPFDTWDPHAGKPRRAGNERERTPPPRHTAPERRVRVPDELVEDFRVLGLPPGVTLAECKAAWKGMLKRYHPDTANGDPAAQARHTQVSTRLNDAYARISRWYRTGSVD